MMDDNAWRAPDTDQQGFVNLTKLASQAANLRLDQFVLAYPVPGLLVVQREGDLGEREDGLGDQEDSGVQLLTVSIKSAAILRYLNKVGFVCKRPGNPFAHLISIGRSVSNDLVVGIETVSKVHGYFVRDNDDWFFNDRSSTNGSKINDLAIEPGVRTPLHDGDYLQLGLEVSFQFLLPPSLYHQARQALRS